MATRNTATPPPDTPTSGFTDEERSELATMIAEAIASAKPPTGGPASSSASSSTSAPRQPTEGEWDVMSDRQRESWVRQLVDFRLEELRAAEDQLRLAGDVEQLKNERDTPQPEAPPSIVTRLQRLWWGEPDK